MCVICYKPAGKDFPSKTKIKTMFKNNPDGAGFMYADGGKVYIKKGLMTLQDFNTELNRVKNKNLPFVLHFRITTNGGTNKGMTHPFPITDKIKDLQAVNISTNIGLAHNGIIPLTSYAKKISDTAEFIRKYVYRLVKLGLDNDILTMIDELGQSKFAIMQGNKNVYLIGDFVQDGNGIFYSNTSYKPAKKKNTKKSDYSYFSNYSYFDDYYNCCNECSLCKYEYDCMGAWELDNPYNPKNYNLLSGGDNA